MSNELLREQLQLALNGVPENSYLGELLSRCYVALGEGKSLNEYRQDVMMLNMEVEQLKAQIVALGEQASVPDCDQLTESLERVRLTVEEAKQHGDGAVYWNSAVLLCKIALREALATYRAAQEQAK